VALPVPDDISATIALNFGRLAEGPICKAFGQAEPIQHPVDRVARYAQQLGRTLAIALGRLQRANQCELRGLAGYGIERVGPILRDMRPPVTDERFIDEFAGCVVTTFIVKRG